MGWGGMEGWAERPSPRSTTHTLSLLELSSEWRVRTFRVHDLRTAYIFSVLLSLSLCSYHSPLDDDEQVIDRIYVQRVPLK